MANPSHPRHVLVVADGDVPARAALDEAWPGWDAGAGSVIAADGGLRNAERLGLTATLLVGDLDSLATSEVDRARATGLPIRPARADKDESDAELALLAALELGATRITVVGAFGGPRLDHALANLWLLAHPALGGCEIVLLDAAARVSLVTAPGGDGGPVTRALPGRTGAVVSLLPFAGDAEGVATRGLRFALRDEPLRIGPARGLSNVRISGEAAVTVRSGRLLVVEAAAARPGILLAMSMPVAGDQAPEVALPDEHGTIHRLSDRRGSWTVIYFYPKDDTPGCTTEACQFRDLNGQIEGRGAVVWGISPDGQASHAAFRAKHDLTFLLLSDVDHAAAEAWGAWQLKTNYGKSAMGIVRSSFLVAPDGRIARAWPKVAADGHAAEVLAALEAERGASAG